MCMCLCVSVCVLPGCGKGFPHDARQSIKRCCAVLRVGVKELVSVSVCNPKASQKDARFFSTDSQQKKSQQFPTF